MNNTLKNTTAKKNDFISGYQMIGGLIGLAFMFAIFFNVEEINNSYIFILGLGFLFYIFSFIAGLFLFQGKTYALKISLINQILQIFGFSFWGYGFEYVAGVSFDFFIKYTDSLDFTINIGLSNWHILLNNDTGIEQVSINMVALVLAIFIVRLQKQNNVEKSNIGT